MGDQLHPGAPPPSFPTPPSTAPAGFIFPQPIPTTTMPYNHHPPVFHQELDSHPSKRPRYSSMDDRRRLLPPLPNNGNRSMNTRLFFKTRLCDKFIAGENCPYGTKCTYAHGPEELRTPAYDERQGRGQIGGLIDQRNRSNANKVCRKFFGGEECPYGIECIFLHQRPEGLQESLAISVPISNGGVEAAAGGREVIGDHMWKTRMCIKWESTGACPYGEGCHFAHGYTELRKLGGGNMESGRMNVMAAAPIKPPPVSCAVEIPKKPEPAPRKNYLKWTDPKKIGRIYGDWI